MFTIRLIATVGLAAMSVAVLFGLVSGGFATEGRAILDLVWGRVTLIDLYVGIGLFASFVVWREGSPLRAGAWIIAFVVLGNLATAAYVFNAARRSASVEEMLTKR